MSLIQIKFISREELAEGLEHLGADSRSLPFFENRRDVKILYLEGIDVRGANVIKQEMLSCGGDAAVHAKAVAGTVKTSDCIVFGTKKQLAHLADKLSTMPWWGFPQIVEELRGALQGLSSKSGPLALPGGRSLPLGGRTLVMSIVNLTDDSFYAGSRVGDDTLEALARAKKAVASGADIIDLGAESTRPGSSGVSESDELERVTAAVRAIREELPEIPISVDTTRLRVAESALEAGADIINDISGLTYEPKLAQAAAKYGAPLVLMHMRGTPETMQTMCDYDNLLIDIARFFEKGIELAAAMGLARDRIILDPGIGFAKNYDQNLHILRHLEAFETFGLPTLIGVSRKGFIGKATDSATPAERLEGTLAISALCAWKGADIIRVHDAAENKKAVMMIEAVKNAKFS